MNKNIDFVNGNTKKCLLEMTVPMIIAMFLNMAYNLVDSLWIGNLLGEQAYAALTNSTPIILILTSIGMGATNGLCFYRIIQMISVVKIRIYIFLFPYILMSQTAINRVIKMEFFLKYSPIVFMIR